MFNVHENICICSAQMRLDNINKFDEIVCMDAQCNQSELNTPKIIIRCDEWMML